VTNWRVDNDVEKDNRADRRADRMPMALDLSTMISAVSSTIRECFTLMKRRIAPMTTARALATLMLVIGCGLRVIEYAKDRAAWKDEYYLSLNVLHRPVFEFDQPMIEDQLAPPGFLVLARVSSRVLGGSRLAVRFLPLVCGVACLFALRRLAERVVSPRAVPIALALAAFSDDLIYYSTEFKQYSCDLLIAQVLILLLLDMGSRPITARCAAVASVMGILATWLSHPSIFVLASGGVWLFTRVLMARRWGEAGWLMGVGALWLSSFDGCYLVSLRLLGDGVFMWTWWDFAFLPIPPLSWADLQRDFWAFANVFTNPVGIVTPIGPIVAGLLAMGLFAIGGLSLRRSRERGVLALLLGPIALTMLASALHRYPFHGRVLIFLVPGLLLPVAEGVAAIGRRGGSVLMGLLIAFLLVSAVNDAIYFVEHRRYRTFDTHGDQRNDLLDALEYRARQSGLKEIILPKADQPSSHRS
jgi:hypothetical protein